MINIVLVCIGNFQEYIFENIKQLIFLKHESIYVVTDRIYLAKFQKFAKHIHLVSIDTLNDVYNYNAGKNIDKMFRNGFWELTSKRFFYIYSLMKSYNLKDVIHIENDVLVYYNCNSLLELLDKNKIYFPIDSYKRAVASIMYIPNQVIFGSILSKYDINQSDMLNFARIQKLIPNAFENFPIGFREMNFSSEQQHVTRLFDTFKIIFDGAAIGQYLGGIDPRNTPGNTIGFISKECVIKYNTYQFIWNNINKNGNKPYLSYRGNIIPIFNLHVHSKKLINFVSYTYDDNNVS
jgi:hypothetical protein